MGGFTKQVCFSALTILSCVCWLTEGHIVLTYPKARKYAFDFVNNARTVPPCGMPRNMDDQSPVTVLEAGSTFVVTWNIVYAHQGGYKIEILNSTDDVISTLTPGSGFVGENDTTTIEHQVTLDAELTCDDCTLRVVRQATERPSCNPDGLLFWACANINITNATKYTETCSGHGTYKSQSGKCKCESKYLGTKCQYEQDCIRTSDCNSHGYCEEINPLSTWRRKACFCLFGWHGRFCNIATDMKEKITDLSGYTKELLNGPNYELFFKKDSTMMHVVIRAKTVTWVGIGWKPLGLKSGCQSFPDIRWDETERETSPEPTSTTAPGTTAKPCPKPQRVPTYNAPTEGGAIIAMACSDMVIGAARQDRHWIGDYYARDRGEPQRDEVLGGSYSLRGAIGYEEGDTTVIAFKRPLTSSEKTDYPIEGTMQFIWAVGQEEGNYVHNPNSLSGLDVGKPSNSDFYKRDELKYHGYSGKRGYATINLAPSDGTVPTSVVSYDGRYKVEWRYINGDDDKVEFTMELAGYTAGSGRYFAMGLSADRTMPNTDVIAAWISSNGEVSLSDRWADGRVMPTVDTQNDVKLVSGGVSNGVAKVVFTRKPNTGDSQDFKISEEECPYLFLVRGPVVNGTINQHDMAPDIQADKICILSSKKGSKDDETMSMTSKIIIGVVCGVVLICVIGVAIVCMKRKKASRA